MAGRAHNGQGSIRKRANGLYEKRITTPDGRTKSIYARDMKTLQQKAIEARSQIEAGVITPKYTTVGTWLATWLEEYSADKTKSSKYAYQNNIRHINAHIGDVRLRDLKPIHVRKMLNGLTNEGLAAKTVRVIWATLHAALEKARREAKIIMANPASDVRPPKDSRQRFRVVPQTGIRDFLEAADGTKYANEAKFMFLTGVRVGELRGLKWSDVDIDGGTVYIQRQMCYTGNEYYEDAPKRDEKREIVLAPPAVQVLKDQRRRVAEDRLRAGSAWVDDGLSQGRVFRQRNGAHHTQATITGEIHSIGRRMGLERLTPHDLRHSHAVAALQSGTDVKTLQHNLGHANAAMTLDMYAAYTTDAGKAGAAKLGAFWQDAAGGKG